MQGNLIQPVLSYILMVGAFCAPLQASGADESLKLHLTFDQAAPSAVYADASGNGNEARQFNATNNIGIVPGVFGNAGEWTYAGFTQTDGSHIYPAGQYLGVTNLNGILFLTNATISFWAQFYKNNDLAMQLLSGGYSAAYARGGAAAATNGWYIGRPSSSAISFVTYIPGRARTVVSWPSDVVQAGGANPDLSTTAMHLYTVTVDCVANRAITYYDGQPYQTNTIDLPWLRVYGGYYNNTVRRWIAVGTATMDGTPEWGDDKYPNSGYFVGKMDDIRIYDRALTRGEITSLFTGLESVVDVTASDAAAGEPATGKGNGTFRFTRTGSTGEALTVNFAVGGTATPGSDYTPLQTSVTFPAGSGTVTRTVTVLDDSGHEGEETVIVTLADGTGYTGYTVGTSPATVTISDDDPTIIIDDPAATYSGDWAWSSEIDDYYGVGYRHDQNTGKGTKSARFTPTIPQRGTYEVYFYYTADSNRATNAPVDVAHAMGTNTVRVNQRVNGGMWNLLGTFEFDPGTDGYVRVRTTGTVNHVIVDAVKFVLIGTTAPVTIAGNVGYYGTDSPVREAPVALSGGAELNTTTGDDGDYEAWVRRGLDYRVAPVVQGDAPPARGVTTLDIALIRRHILGQEYLDSPFKVLGADVNESRSISTLDISLMRRLILGTTNTLPGGLWRFVPAEHVFTNALSPWNAPTNRSHTNLMATASGQDFVAVKLGDVNNSWQPAVVNVAMAKAGAARASTGVRPGEARVSLDNFIVAPGARVASPVRVSGFKGATTLQFTLRWDPAVLRFVGVQDFGLPELSLGNFGMDSVTEGRLTFAWDDPGASGVDVPDETRAFSTVFEAIGQEGSVSSLALVDSPTPIEATMNLHPVELTVEGGQVELGGRHPLVIAPPEHPSQPLNLSVWTEAGVTYVVEYSDTLVDWDILATFVGDGAMRQIVDPDPSSRQRYYRLRRQ